MSRYHAELINFEYCSQLKLHRFASWKNYTSVNSFLPLSKMTKSLHQTGFTSYLPEFWRSSTKFSRFARILPGNVEFNCYHIIYLHQPKSPKSPSRSSPGHHYQDSSPTIIIIIEERSPWHHYLQKYHQGGHLGIIIFSNHHQYHHRGIHLGMAYIVRPFILNTAKPLCYLTNILKITFVNF